MTDVTDLLAKAGVEFVIGGSLASSVWGRERTTHDADIAALISEAQFEQLLPLIQWPYIIDAESIRASLADLEDFASGQILNGESLDKVDLFLLKDEPYVQSQLSRKRMFEVSPGHSLPFASAEDVVITKLRWFELGNRISDRQWNDIVQVLEIQQGELDEQYMARWAAHFGVLELLREAQDQVTKD